MENGDYMEDNEWLERHSFSASVTEAIEKLGIDGLENLIVVTASGWDSLEVPEYPYDISIWDCHRLKGGLVGEYADHEYFELTLSFHPGDEDSYALYDIKSEKVFDCYYNFPTWIWREE